MAGLLDQWLTRPALAHSIGPSQPAAHLVVLWMNGGPSHLETWDPKAGSRHKSIATRTKGLRIAEHMPQLAALSNKLSVIRSVKSGEGNHQRAQYLMHTGYAPNPTIEHPSMGAWLSKLRGDEGGAEARERSLPSFVSVGGPSFSGGFLGVEHSPFVLPKAGTLPANTTPVTGVGTVRFDARMRELDAIEADFLARTGADPKVAGRRQLYSQAVALMRSPKLDAFDLSKESEATRKAFGDTDFGRGCLAAVRLVEAGVRCVEVTLDGWDTHVDVKGRTQKLMQTLDPAMTSLVRELEARHLLDKTLVVWMGDFGRTPKINGNEGRDHHPQSSSVVLAGGDIVHGMVLGETDAEGDKVVKDAVTVPDLMATIAQNLALDPSQMFQTPIGRPIGVTDHGKPIAALDRLGGL